MTPKQALLEVKKQLEQAGVEDAAFDASCLLEYVAGKDWRWAVDTLSPEQCQQLEQLAARRAKREPLQYLLGQWPFLDFELKVGPGVLIPRSDTERLCELAAERLTDIPEPKVLDLCAGSGCVGLGICSLVPTAQVTCLEKSPLALEYLTHNCAHALGEQGANPVEGDVFQFQTQLQPQQWDCIVSNPPYISAQEMKELEPELAFEPEMALEAEEQGLAFYQHIIPAYRFSLKPGGWMAVEIGYQQGNSVADLFVRAGYEQVQVHPDLAGLDRVVMARRPLEVEQAVEKISGK